MIDILKAIFFKCTAVFFNHLYIICFDEVET